jgi:hypothetical protein
MFLNFLSVPTRGESKSVKQLYCKGSGRFDEDSVDDIGDRRKVCKMARKSFGVETMLVAMALLCCANRYQRLVLRFLC